MLWRRYTSCQVVRLYDPHFDKLDKTGPHHIRSMAEALGRQPPSSAFSPDISKHFAFGKHQGLKPVNLDNKDKL
jgi:hypothetical protein